MKLGFIIPILEDCDFEKKFDAISKACRKESKNDKISFDVVFALSGTLSTTFARIRERYVEQENVRAFKVNLPVNQHELITVAMKYMEDYDATIIYSGKDDISIDIVKTFINSWKAGNKIVFYKKQFTGFRRFVRSVKVFFYNLGIKLLNVFGDVYAENDIQLLDREVVRTINQLPTKNRQLRMLDSFVGYETDVLYVTEIKKRPKSKVYDYKSQSHFVSVVLAIVSAVLALLSVMAGILLSAFSVGGFLLHLIVWFGAVFLFCLAFVLAIKSHLSYRVGEQSDMADIKALFDKMEKYNFTR